MRLLKPALKTTEKHKAMTINTLSLYQSLQALKPAPPSLVVSANSLYNLVGAWVDLIIEKQLDLTLWIKAPSKSPWFLEIERYCEQVNPSSPLYLFQDETEEKLQTEGFISVPLKEGTLEGEYFIIARSPNYCSAILVCVLPHSPKLQVVCSFEPPILQKIFTELKPLIHHSNPEAILSKLEINPPPTDTLSQLLLKQLQHTEAIPPSTCETPLVSQEFLSQMVREFSTPVTHQRTALRLLESKKVKGPQRDRYLELLHQQCDRQNALIGGLLELIQIEQTAIETTVTQNDLSEIVAGIVSTYQPLASEKGIQLGYTISANLPLLCCPSNWLKQIIIHLLNNSLNFTPSGGQVQVFATLQNEFIELSFVDTGIGIAPQDIPKIFNSFYRKPAKPEEELKSAGLGLTIVQELVKRCGGTITVTSKIGKGSTFKVLLPLSAEE